MSGPGALAGRDVARLGSVAACAADRGDRCVADVHGRRGGSVGVGGDGVAAWHRLPAGSGADLVPPDRRGRVAEREGFPDRVVALVAHHSCERFEAARRDLADELARWPLETSRSCMRWSMRT